MTVTALRLGPVRADGYVVRHSGIRWLLPDGCACRAGEVIGYANIGLLRTAGSPAGRMPFATEVRDFQVGFATPVGGVLRHAAQNSIGGHLDLLDSTLHWSADNVIATIQSGATSTTPAPAQVDARLLFMAGRRMTELAEVRSGMLAGWHSRTRAWWGDVPARADVTTVASLGICELLGVIRGEQFAFHELFAALPGPAQFVYYPGEVMTPCAITLAQQLDRTPAQLGAIAADMAQGLLSGIAVPRPADWLFAGCLLDSLESAPLTESSKLLTREGVRDAAPPRAVLLSLWAESSHLLRHRKLGYTLFLPRAEDAGPAIRDWLNTAFEPVRRRLDDIARDYADLFAAARRHGAVDFLILNRMATNGAEELYDYALFDPPLGETLQSIRSLELNLMLHDLARAHDISIVDVDALAAEFGGAVHLADNVHQSGALQAAIRDEIIRILRDRKLPGFAPTATQAPALAAAD